MRVLLVGCGGIGSWFVEHVERAFHDTMDMESDVTFDIADPDIVEPKNFWQNFIIKDMGKNKAESLKRRYSHVHKAIAKPVFGVPSDLKGYDIVVMAVDSAPTRGGIIRYCYENNMEFIDLRAEDKTALAMPKSGDLLDDLGTLDLNDKESGSCQRADYKTEGMVNYGCKIAAALGIQMLMNTLNGDRKSNRKTVVKL